MEHKDKAAVLVENGIRWCNNILVELLSNYGLHIPPRARASLQEAIQELGSAVGHMPKPSGTNLISVQRKNLKGDDK